MLEKNIQKMAAGITDKLVQFTLARCGDKRLDKLFVQLRNAWTIVGITTMESLTKWKTS